MMLYETKSRWDKKKAGRKQCEEKDLRRKKKESMRQIESKNETKRKQEWDIKKAESKGKI